MSWGREPRAASRQQRSSWRQFVSGEASLAPSRCCRAVASRVSSKLTLAVLRCQAGQASSRGRVLGRACTDAPAELPAKAWSAATWVLSKDAAAVLAAMQAASRKAPDGLEHACRQV